VLTVVECTSAAEWDGLVAGHPRGHLLQSWGWGELSQEPHWQRVRLAVVDRGATASGPPAAAQVLVRRIGGVSVCYVPQGPMFSGEPALDRALLGALRRVARRHGALFLHLEPNVLVSSPDAGALRALLRGSGFRVGEAYERSTSIQIDLAPTPERIFASFSRWHRRHVRRAERDGVSVRIGTTTGDLDSFHAILSATAARKDFTVFGRDYFRRVWERCAGYVGLLIASKEGAGDVSAQLTFAFGREAQNMFGGSTAVGLESGANYLLHWHSIRWARERGCDRLDLWGVPDAGGDLDPLPEDEAARMWKWSPGDGLYRFKRGWGGVVVRYVPAYDQVYVPPAYWAWNRLEGLRRLHGRLFHP
jgi:lipid II:glycine glycyltransferase (peptidoglycan interpeptide bridge formation enzyme)